METWMIHALLGMLVMGIFGILQKIEAESKMNRSWFIAYSNIGMIIFPVIIGLYNNIHFEFDMILFWIAFITQGAYIVVLKLRLRCLDYMTSSTYFINYRIMTSILLVLVGQILFLDNILLNEYLGIFLGFIVFILLIEKKDKDESLKNLKRGYIYLCLSIIIASIIWVISRYIAAQDYPIELYALYGWISGTIVTLLSKWKDTLRDVMHIKWWKQAAFLALAWLVFWTWVILHVWALRQGWDLAIVYKILSYSLFFPIIFSILYYKEPLTPRKILAFILTVVSIWLFI